MATPGFPLPLRNALAELGLAACEDDAAAAALGWLAAPADAPPPAAAARLAAVHLIDPGGRALLPVHAPHAAAVAAHARRALRAAAAFRRGPPGAGVVRACRVAAALWNEGLFFEVHEVLEAVWKTAAGAERQALQGVIQIAVAFHHLAHGNRRGARSLLQDRARQQDHQTVTPDRVPVLVDDTDAVSVTVEGDADICLLVLHHHERCAKAFRLSAYTSAASV